MFRWRCEVRVSMGLVDPNLDRFLPLLTLTLTLIGLVDPNPDRFLPLCPIRHKEVDPRHAHIPRQSPDRVSNRLQ